MEEHFPILSPRHPERRFQLPCKLRNINVSGIVVQILFPFFELDVKLPELLIITEGSDVGSEFEST